jgi:hypothetical protein
MLLQDLAASVTQALIHFVRASFVFLLFLFPVCGHARMGLLPFFSRAVSRYSTTARAVWGLPCMVLQFLPSCDTSAARP